VTLHKGKGRWQVQCQIGGKQTKLGSFGSEGEAARAWDRIRLWSCKASGKKKEEVHLNFHLSDYTDDEVAALQELRQEEVIQKLRRAAKQTSRVECGAKAVERPASPRPVAGGGPANLASSPSPDKNCRGALRARTKRTYESDKGGAEGT
jgi:hypothetical protein